MLGYKVTSSKQKKPFPDCIVVLDVEEYFIAPQVLFFVNSKINSFYTFKATVLSQYIYSNQEYINHSYSLYSTDTVYTTNAVIKSKKLSLVSNNIETITERSVNWQEGIYFFETKHDAEYCMTVLQQTYKHYKLIEC